MATKWLHGISQKCPVTFWGRGFYWSLPKLNALHVYFFVRLISNFECPQHSKNISPTSSFSPLFTASHANVVFSFPLKLTFCWTLPMPKTRWAQLRGETSTWLGLEAWFPQLCASSKPSRIQYGSPFILMKCSSSAQTPKRFLSFASPLCGP